MYLGTLAPASNRAGFSRTFEVIDDDTGDLIDLSDCEIAFEARDPVSRTTVLSASVGSGVTVEDTGVFNVAFTAAQMRALCSKTYEVGCTISNADSEPQQIIIGSLPILDGIVT